MSSLVPANHPLSLQLTNIPNDCIVSIFGFLDLKNLKVVAFVCKLFDQLQQADVLWYGLFPKIESLHLGSPAKERVQRVIPIIPLGNQEEGDKGCLDLYNKIITPANDSPAASCLAAISHPQVSKGSFVVYMGNNLSPSAVIKTKEGTVEEITGPTLREAFGKNSPAVAELRAHEGKPSQFNEYTLLVDEDCMRSNLELTSTYLKTGNTKKKT